MILSPVQKLQAARDDLNAVGAQWALIGGWAIAAHAQPRTTEDIDFAVVADGTAEEDRIVFALRAFGYEAGQVFLHDYRHRAATVRLIDVRRAIKLDLLFGNSGIEDVIVGESDDIEIMPGLCLPVVSLPHLIALKVLAARPKDVIDLEVLIPAASPADLDHARRAMRLIQKRGYHRDKSLLTDLERFIARYGQ